MPPRRVYCGMAVSTDTWASCFILRRRMRSCGRASAVFIVAAFFCLADGLYSAVRVGSEVLELLPGQTLMLSGPSPLKNPLNSDFVARITPPGEDVRFTLEGFFASYWFGSAMWRGAVQADAGAEPGRRELLIRFRGAPAKSAQKYSVIVWENEAVKRGRSLRRAASHGRRPCGARICLRSCRPAARRLHISLGQTVHQKFVGVRVFRSFPDCRHGRRPPRFLPGRRPENPVGRNLLPCLHA